MNLLYISDINFKMYYIEILICLNKHFHFSQKGSIFGKNENYFLPKNLVKKKFCPNETKTERRKKA